MHTFDEMEHPPMLKTILYWQEFLESVHKKMFLQHDTDKNTIYKFQKT